MDQVLHNAARAFQAAHLLAKAISVRKILIDPRYNLEKSDLGRKAVRDIGHSSVPILHELKGTVTATNAFGTGTLDVRRGSVAEGVAAIVRDRDAGHAPQPRCYRFG